MKRTRGRLSDVPGHVLNVIFFFFFLLTRLRTQRGARTFDPRSRVPPSTLSLSVRSRSLPLRLRRARTETRGKTGPRLRTRAPTTPERKAPAREAPAAGSPAPCATGRPRGPGAGAARGRPAGTWAQGRTPGPSGVRLQPGPSRAGKDERETASAALGRAGSPGVAGAHPGPPPRSPAAAGSRPAGAQSAHRTAHGASPRALSPTALAFGMQFTCPHGARGPVAAVPPPRPRPDHRACRPSPTSAGGSSGRGGRAAGGPARPSAVGRGPARPGAQAPSPARCPDPAPGSAPCPARRRGRGNTIGARRRARSS